MAVTYQYDCLTLIDGVEGTLLGQIESSSDTINILVRDDAAVRLTPAGDGAFGLSIHDRATGVDYMSVAELGETVNVARVASKGGVDLAVACDLLPIDPVS